MNRVDEILAGHTAETTGAGAEIEAPLERFARPPHAEKVRELSRVSGLHTTLVIGFQWLVIVGCLTAFAVWPRWYVLLIGGVIVATRAQALGALLHDAVHYLLYRNRTVNDVVGDLFVAFPLGMSTTLYRKTHFRHHRFTNTDQDQDLAAQQEDGEWYCWPKSRRGLAASLIRSALGVNAAKAWILYKHWSPWNNLRRPLDADFPLRARVLYLLSLTAVYSLIFYGLRVNWQVTLGMMAMYAVPMLTLLNLCNRLRATAEHVGVERTHELNSTRTVVPGWLARLFVAPLNMSYHLEHHLFPSVPCRNLVRLHRHLMQDAEFRDKAHITRSYAGLLRELMSLDEPTESRE